MPPDNTGSGRTPQPVDSPGEDFGEVRRYLKGAIARACAGWAGMDVDDLTQRAVLKVMERSRKKPLPEGLSHAYLSRVAYNQVIDEFRRRRREAPMERYEAKHGELPARTPDPEHGSVVTEIGKAIQDCLRKLSLDRRRATGLMLLGHANQEIAKLMGWGTKRAENLVTRGKRDLQMCLRRMGLEP